MSRKEYYHLSVSRRIILPDKYARLNDATSPEAAENKRETIVRA